MYWDILVYSRSDRNRVASVMEQTHALVGGEPVPTKTSTMAISWV